MREHDKIQQKIQTLNSNYMKGCQSMKHTKKLFSVLLTLVMALALAVPAFAAGTNSITVNNAKAGENYSIYKMLDLSVNEANTAYSYTVNSNWKNFFRKLQ